MKGFAKYVKMNGGEDPPTKLTPKQLQEWNAYVDWLDSKKMKGSKELDKGTTGLKYFEMYAKENPSLTLKKENIKQVQEEMEALAQGVRDFATRRNDPNAQNLMRGTSKFDGIPGSKTTSFKFPIVTQENYRNNTLTSQANLGLMGGDMKPTGLTSGLANPKIPRGAKVERLQDGYYYEDEKTGDLVKVGEL